MDSLPVSEVEADTTALVLEQEQDPSLANCWMQAQAGKGGFLTHKGLLYHKDHVKVRQSVSSVCPRVAGLRSCSWPMSQRCLTFSRVVFVNHMRVP